ncbi:MAG: hypothetical protein ACRDI1_04525 [Actinomycetota bacterium]
MRGRLRIRRDRRRGRGPRVALAAVSMALVVLGPTVPAVGKVSPPSTLNGLRVAQEKVGKAPKSERQQFLTEIELFSLRQANKQLEATIQVGKFLPGAPVGSLGFQREIAGQIGTTVPREQRVDGVPVFVTKGKKLGIALWFRDGHIFILSIREGYGQPKTLIREALRMNP